MVITYTKRYVILRDGEVTKVWDSKADRLTCYVGDSDPVEIPDQTLHSMLKFHPYADSIEESDTFPSITQE